MSRLATLPDAQRVELIENVRAGYDRIVPIEGGRARIDMTDAAAIYVADCSVIVRLRSMPGHQWRFVMADETAARVGADRLAHISVAGGRQ